MAERRPSDSVPRDVDVEKGINPNASDLEGATIRPESGREAALNPDDAPKENDPNIVDWDGPDDPQNPQNWPASQKWMNIAVISILTLVTPLGSSMFAPGIPKIMVEFHETSSMTATFVVSVYILGFAFGPLMVAPLSEVYGRRLLYNWGNVLFTVFTVGAALAKNMPMLMAFRFLMGLAGSVPITIGSGSIADIMPIEQRGRAMSAWAMGPLLGPCIGPVAGGYLIKAAGWRWIYWLVVIVGGVFIPLSWFLMKETFAPVLLEQKTKRLRKETGNENLRSKLETEAKVSDKFKFAIIRPLKLLFATPIVTLMALYVAVTYGILYLLITTFSFVFKDYYGFDEGTVGLTFLPAGIGMIIGVGTFGTLTDYIVKRNKDKGLPHRPEIRLSPAMAMPCGVVLPIGLFLYGWTVEKHVHFIVPMLGVVIFAAGLMGVMTCVQNYLLDAYPRYAASVTAALAVLRSLAGALLPLGGLEMYNALGLGWGNSLLGFIALGLVPIPLLFYLFGERIRNKFKPNL
ncbi:Efflux pump rdc3 [Colletotrichum fructicola]|uniref:Efflux pump rdc3 n=1 Tax=Colletotrichum fructicola (strain Nara gc5) TaxID=1213859 RepID=L2FRS4_COLFN|nr:Efflux pump rdc3 [Colletotrichum fructicola]KAF4483199.1 Efflux pump rdc3 [Colletotrichum fructicola Nara gc5]KAI8279687.1 Efflux pump rdc3 [Colletotrichum sp. SAR11_57]KAE9574152.1 Efflux pump rdc3 [Colletotrichum fructicola]KAF4430689.1 Efflux pump rdc3 [Colletotrichum fructicola]KAF4881263.1 Efflux pump rdc3 [Colletotrichum fructicola]